MAKSGFRVFDKPRCTSLELPDLWRALHIDPSFAIKRRAAELRTNVPLGNEVSNVPEGTRRTGGTPHRGRNFNKNQDIYRNQAAARLDRAQCSSKRWRTRASMTAVPFPTRGCASSPFPTKIHVRRRLMARA